MKALKQISFTLLFMLLVVLGDAQDFSPYRYEVFNEGDQQLPYRILAPMVPAKKYPLFIFLHGAFEKGVDNELPLRLGGRFFLRDSIRNNYPAFVLFPQCPMDDSWAYFENEIDVNTGTAHHWKFPFNKKPTRTVALLQKLIDRLVLNDSIDPSRIYIAGLSQGAMGVLDMIARQPDRFAAAIAVCGAGAASTSKYFSGKVPLWLFHGDKDPIVPVTFSRDYYKTLTKLGSVVRYNEYKGVEHNSWVQAFSEPELMKWIFGQVKILPAKIE